MSEITENATPRDNPPLVEQVSPPGNQFPPGGRRRPHRGRIFIVLLLAGVVAFGYFEGSQEIAHWYVAAALVQHARGSLAPAESLLDQALRWDPGNRSALLCQAEWRMETGDYAGSLACVERVLGEAPDDLRAIVGQTQALQHLGRETEAIQVFENLLERRNEANRLERSLYMNGLAYARAVAGVQLDQALQEVNESMRLFGIDTAEVLDTRGYILFQLGQLDPALADLTQAVRQIQNRLTYERVIRAYVDPFEQQQKIAALQESAAVIHYHRALVREQLGLEDAAQLDRDRVRQLGFDPDTGVF